MSIDNDSELVFCHYNLTHATALFALALFTKFYWDKAFYISSCEFYDFYHTRRVEGHTPIVIVCFSSV